VINQQTSRKSKEYIKSGGFPPLLFENNYMKMIPSVTNRELDETFIYQGLSWQPRITSRGDLGITGPFCKRCNVSLAGGVVKCWNCNADYSKILDSDLVELRSKAHKIYEANARSKYPVINFDIPPTSLSHSTTEDENFFVGYKFGQEKGRKQLHIWVGEREKDQSNKDKVQLVIDVDKEEFRHDQTNKFPGEIIANAKIVFKKSSTDINYEKIVEG